MEKLDLIFISGCAIGIIGCLPAIPIVLYRSLRQRSSAQWYVLQLLIASFLHLITLPFFILEADNVNLFSSEWACTAKEVASHLSYYVSVLFLLALALDRYIAVCVNSMSVLQRCRNTIGACAISVLLWIVGIVCTAPVMLYSFKVGVFPRCSCAVIFPSSHHLYQSVDDVCSLKDAFNAELCNLNAHNSELFCIRQNRDDKQNLIDPVEQLAPIYMYEDLNSQESDTLPLVCKHQHQAGDMTAYIAFNIVLYVVALLAILMVFFLMFRRLRRPESRWLGFSATDKTALSRQLSETNENRQISKNSNVLSVAHTAALALCFFLHHVIQLARFRGISSSEEGCTNLLLAATALVVLYFALNPYIYLCFGVILPMKSCFQSNCEINNVVILRELDSEANVTKTRYGTKV